MKNKINKSTEIIPKVFMITYGSYRGMNNFSITIEDGKILPSDKFHYFKKVHEFIIPSEKEWKEFWKKMDQINIWNWCGDYEPEGQVLDGYFWNLKIKLSDKKIKSSGSNAYPGDAIGEIIDYHISSSFKMFLDAVEELTKMEIKRYED